MPWPSAFQVAATLSSGVPPEIIIGGNLVTHSTAVGRRFIVLAKG
jgi:hypothetical protein